MKNIIDELLIVVQELNTKSDEMTRRIEVFEEDLKKLGVGLTCWVKVDETLRVGYMKFGGEWKLASELTSEDDKKSYMPLIHTNRGIRLAGYNRRNEILVELLETAKKLSKKLDESLNGE